MDDERRPEPPPSREQLLRAAYGSSATDAERAAALAELARRDVASAATAGGAAPGHRADAARNDPPPPEGRTIARQLAAASAARASPTDDRVRWLRDRAPVLAIAAVVGALLGATAVRLTVMSPAESDAGPEIRSATGSLGGNVLPPLDDEDPIRPSTLDLLWTDRASGNRAYWALTESDAICLIGVSPIAVAQTCADSPLLPEGGLTVELPVDSEFGELGITWLPGGEIRIDDGFEVRVEP